MTRPRFVLGSGSPRRREILAQLGLCPDAVIAPEIDETPLKGELPRDYARRIAREKAQALTLKPGDVLLAADTTVALGRHILGKPVNSREAAAFLNALSGRRHKVITAIAVRKGDAFWERDVISTVRFKRLSGAEVKGYLATGDWQGKAGAYAIQGPAGAFIPWIKGSFSAIMGLPAAETATLLAAAGLHWTQCQIGPPE